MKVIESTYYGSQKWLHLYCYIVVIVLGVWKGAPGYLHIVENTI